MGNRLPSNSMVDPLFTSRNFQNAHVEPLVHCDLEARPLHAKQQSRRWGIPSGRGKSVDCLRRHPHQQLARQAGTLVRSVHPRQRTRPDADTLCGATNEAAGFTPAQSPREHPTAVPPWVELSDDEDLLGNSLRGKGLLHQSHHCLFRHEQVPLSRSPMQVNETNHSETTWPRKHSSCAARHGPSPTRPGIDLENPALRVHRRRSVTLLLFLLFLLRRLRLLAPRGLCYRRTAGAHSLVADIPRDAVTTGHHLLTGPALGLIVEDVATDQDPGRVEGFDLHTVKDTANRGCRMVARQIRT